MRLGLIIRKSGQKRQLMSLHFKNLLAVSIESQNVVYPLKNFANVILDYAKSVNVTLVVTTLYINHLNGF